MKQEDSQGGAHADNFLSLTQLEFQKTGKS
jgi:hypothetical protein